VQFFCYASVPNFELTFCVQFWVGDGMSKSLIKKQSNDAPLKIGRNIENFEQNMKSNEL